MKQTILGSTGISVSRLCFGTLTMGPLQRNLPLVQGVGLLDLAFSLGVNFLDTAEIYGTYAYVKQALHIKPDIVVCTKSYSYDEQTAEQSFREAVKGIGREYIDIFLLHEQESRHTLRGHWQAVEFFLRKKQQGLIGAVGLSTHHIAAVEASARYPELEVVFPLINAAGIGIADGSKEQMLEQMQRVHTQGKGIIAMKPLGGGHLIKDRRQAMRFVLDLPCVHSIAVGMQSEAEVRYNCALFAGEEPDAALLPDIDAQPRKLMIHDWCTGCGACVQRCRNRALSLADGRACVDTAQCALCGYCAAVCPQFCIKVI